MTEIRDLTVLRGTVLTTARLNVRYASPSRGAKIVRTAEPGSQLGVRAIGIGEDVAGNDKWYAGEEDTYFWTGGCSGFSPAVNEDAAAFRVPRRANGTIAPLTNHQIEEVFGKFEYKDTSGGRIEISKNWVSENIVKLATPVLEEEGFPKIEVHKKAQQPFKRVFEIVAERGLESRILTCAGTFVPRHKGWDPSRSLSSHAWGIAIDINVAWNPYGHTPAGMGQHGSVRELVPIFEQQGFAWGGYFSAPYQDGMHFELARLDLE